MCAYGEIKRRLYAPNRERAEIYDSLYAEYKELVHYFGKENNVMKRLKAIKNRDFAKGEPPCLKR